MSVTKSGHHADYPDTILLLSAILDPSGNHNQGQSREPLPQLPWQPVTHQLNITQLYDRDTRHLIENRYPAIGSFSLPLFGPTKSMSLKWIWLPPKHPEKSMPSLWRVTHIWSPRPQVIIVRCAERSLWKSVYGLSLLLSLPTISSRSVWRSAGFPWKPPFCVSICWVHLVSHRGHNQRSERLS